MLGFGWLTLRQAREAIRTGRLDEAERLLGQPSVRERRGAGDLLVALTRGYVRRGEDRLRHDDPEGAWADLLRAEQLQTAENSTGPLRQKLTRLGIAEVRALLQAGETRRASEGVARLRQRGVRSPELQVLEEVAQRWTEAVGQAERGEFAKALETSEQAKRLLPISPYLEQLQGDLSAKRETFSKLVSRLREGAEQGRWGDVIEAAEHVLTLAPQHAEARKVRGQAWQSLTALKETIPFVPGQARANAAEPSANGKGEPALPARFLLWIDGVGGYLLCLGNRLTFGQAWFESHPVDVPLVADVSRLHATITRDGEGYVLEAVHPVQVNHKAVTRALLKSGDRVTLGGSCQFLFQVPVPVSTTARLDLVSGQRLPLAVDGVVLMADNLVLGPGPQAHVVIPDLETPVVLFRHPGGLGLRHKQTLTVDGREAGQRELLGQQATVAGEDISFTIEPVGVRMGH
jgi:hypothetical protein